MRLVAIVVVAGSLLAVLTLRPQITSARLDIPICQIVLNDNGFNPSVARVPPGTVVLWINMTATDQNVVASNQNQFPWSLGLFPPGYSVQAIASDIGTFEYSAESNPSQTASIIVEDGALDCRRPALPEPRPCPPGPGAIVKRIAVVLIKFEDDDAEPWGVEDVRQALFTDAEYAASSWYCEVSFGKAILQGDFYEVTIPYPFTSCPEDVTPEIDALVADQGVDLSGYNNIMYFSNSSGCPGDRGQVGADPGRTWDGFSVGSLPTAIVHELGHNYGLAHANGYSCTQGGQQVPVGDTCTSMEYADPFDAMGNGGIGHFNAYNKARLG